MSIGLRSHVDADTQGRISQVPGEMCGEQPEVWNPCGEKYAEKTVVRSGRDAMNAFKKYTEFFQHVLAEWEPSSDKLVMVPCGSSKPIGSSTIHQKKITAIREGGLEDADVVILSEPCTIIPSEYRLSLPAMNYDFPPQYTDQTEYEQVFDLFTSRLATWLDAVQHDEVYPFLIEGHQNKFDAALERMTYSPDVYEIPSASYNPESESYSGDRFKKQAEMTAKVAAVLQFKAGKDVDVPDDVAEFYQSKFC